MIQPIPLWPISSDGLAVTMLVVYIGLFAYVELRLAHKLRRKK